MKKLLIFVLFIAVVAGAALWFLSSRKAGSAAFVPADSVLYVAFPDMKRSGERWSKTALAQIGADPAVAAFLQQPLSKIDKGGLGEAKAILAKLDPKSLFFAVTKVATGGAQVVLGCEYAGSRQALDESLERLHREVSKNFPGSAKSTADYQGDVVITLTVGKPVLFSAAHGQWVLLSNDEKTLQQTLDRVAGRGGAPALSENAEYRKVVSHLAENPDLLWYVKPLPLVDLMVEFTKQQGASADAASLEQVKMILGAGGTLVFDGADQKETTFLLCPEAPKYGQLSHSPMAFTTPGTSIFLDSAIDTSTVSSDAYFRSLPPEAQTFLTNAKIDLKQIPKIVGSDLGLLLDWPASALVPNLLMTVDIRDRAAAQNLVQSALAGFGLPATPVDQHGVSVYQLPGAQLVEPSVAVTGTHVLAALTSAEMSRALSIQAGTPTLEGSPTFKPALDAYKKGGIAFGFVDAKGIFERIYNTVRPMAVIAGSMSPQVAEIVDVNKLPETEAISSRLSPIIYSSQQTGEGIFFQSSGPVTLSQGILLVAVGAGAGFAAQMVR